MIEAQLKADTASRRAETENRITSLKESVAEAPAQIKEAQSRLERAEKELELAKSKDYLSTHSTVTNARKNRQQASREFIFYSVLLEGNSKALEEWNALPPLERASRLQQEPGELRVKLQAHRAEEASLEQRIALIEESLQIERQLFDLDLEFELTAAESMANAAQSRDEVHTPRNLIENDFLLARATGAAHAQPLLVNFTAHSAINARRMEVTVFVSDDVAPLLAEFTEARLHLDTRPPALRDDNNRRAQEIAGTTSVPMYLALDPRSGEELGRYSGPTQDPAKFADFLADVSKRFDRFATPATDTDLWRRIFELEERVHSFKARQEAGDGSKSLSREQPR